METKRPSSPFEVPDEITELQHRVEQWRKVRRGREAMPSALWNQAAHAARQFGVARVCRCTRLDYSSLKEHVAVLLRQEDAGTGPRPGFIELMAPPAVPALECLIELEHPRGARMRIHLKGACAPDLAALCRSFRGRER
jgi:hypothetical protein